MSPPTLPYREAPRPPVILSVLPVFAWIAAVGCLVVGAAILIAVFANEWDVRHDPAAGRDDAEIVMGMTCLGLPGAFAVIALGVNACKLAMGITRREPAATRIMHDVARILAVGSLIVSGLLIYLWWRLPHRHPQEGYLTLLFCILPALLAWTIFLLIR